MIQLLLISLVAAGAQPQQLHDVSAAVGLEPDGGKSGISRVCFADLNGDGRPDVVIDKHLVYLNGAAPNSPTGVRFTLVPAEKSGLSKPVRGTVAVFADLDGDGHLDALRGEYVDKRKSDWEDHGQRTAWQRGKGDGTFGEPRPIAGVPEATTCAIAVADVDRDGALDLWLANWYFEYGASVAAYPNHLVTRSGKSSWSSLELPVGADDVLEPETDLDGRPTYGAMIASLGGGALPDLLELNYGRRWNRVWRWTETEKGQGEPAWLDLAPALGLDGDDIRHGRHPDWVQGRNTEMPFRANGNSFDCSVGDVDNDGDFDLFVAAITHGWAGDSSDRSRLEYNRLVETGELRFEYDPERCFDRIPEGVPNWNQGDLFCALADLDHDTRLDLILSSGDYPDRQILRIYTQKPDGAFVDSTEAFGLEHDGSQQVSLADFDLDGDLDLLVGQTFNRFTAEMKEGRSPTVRLFQNELTEGRKSIVLFLEGDGKRSNRDALGAVVRVRLDEQTAMIRQLIGIGGHAGKQHDFLVHFGLGEHQQAETLVVEWPDKKGSTQRFEKVEAGRYRLKQGGKLVRLE